MPKTEDLILVSVDDHVVEPPTLFDAHLPEKWKDHAPKLVHKDDGTDVWQYEGAEIPNVGLNAVAGKPPEEYGIEPTALDGIRKGCWDIHERVNDMNRNRHQRHHQLLADRIDRRVGDLREVLLEVIVEQLGFLREHGDRRVGAH